MLEMSLAATKRESISPLSFLLPGLRKLTIFDSSIANPNVSDQAREHAREELGQLQSHENASAGEGRHDANVKRGLKA